MFTTISLTHYMVLSALLFGIGLFGVLAKRNAIAVLICIELMLNAVNINLVAISKYITPTLFMGQLFAIFVITVAAAEVGVGLAIIIAIYRNRVSVNLDDFDWLKW
ncbi:MULTISPECIES: NADH-quinone oxidoreductase subunit NuoK [Desulfofundulus]|jgi:NADH-quinone oxidoreductase subunit K|uniref:NADH-quinone oxidoreductase subunit K n=2 Tax=Desulfofundulus TaxID=2282741 RepID=A0A494WUT0_9FIRM|nr:MULTISPECIES: NADH-quinone oxidoreductase subunit NuoK [Desulfofundulus]AEG15672.1 NAD(P)H-quinone oxidoreductase subunit 4L [Desulfofundulus kuznetsovii DSM 6115]NHM27668.1 NADH-quinone oxidoreductase subunit NuoK [Desulfofundulus sp. TPOSR]RKO66633.1 NADH-quinone oxidoreductase subunit NuoK [Desulfofundulus salinum]